MSSLTRLPLDLTFDLVAADEVPAAHRIETAEFAADEAATFEQFRLRQEVAPSLFLGAFLPSLSEISCRTLVGYVCATLSVFPMLTHASMSKHDPGGRSVCVHAVVVAGPQQGHGIGLALLKEFIARMRDAGLYKRILLICHDDVRPLYEKAGFEYVGPSAVVHGALSWSEMRVMLHETSDDEKELESGPASPQSSDGTPTTPPSLGSLPTGLFEALQLSNASRRRPSWRSFSSFPEGLNNISSTASDSAESKTNTYHVLCPRAGCGSVILKDGIGRLVEKELPEHLYVQLEPIEKAPSTLLTPLPPAGSRVPCWLVEPSPMAFENIGFSRTVERLSDIQGARPTLKLLSCADCDLGPLGWCVSGGRKFWLICARVGYRA